MKWFAFKDPEPELKKILLCEICARNEDVDEMIEIKRPTPFSACYVCDCGEKPEIDDEN